MMKVVSYGEGITLYLVTKQKEGKLKEKVF